MKTLVCSDIHANLKALDAVLLAAGEVDRVWCLGDIIGYGPDPNGVIERLAGLSNLTCLAGNHDLAALSVINLENFNNESRSAIEWQRSILSPESISFLTTLKSKSDQFTNISLAHGSPLDPIWGYVHSENAADMILHTVMAELVMVGHTHMQSFFRQPRAKDRVDYRMTTAGEVIDLDGRFILNPGSVGQPRDHDTRAAFAIYDDGDATFTMRRAAYDIKAVADQIFEFGLPAKNAERLFVGN